MKKALAILLSFLLLFSTLGLTFATHYCAGHAVKSQLMLSNNELKCGMSKANDNCDTDSKESSVQQKSCCSNEYVSMGVENDYQPSPVLSSIDVNFVFTFVHSFIIQNTSDTCHEVAFGDFSPPLPKQDSQVLLQTFLI